MIRIGSTEIPLIDAHTHVFPKIEGIRFKDKPTRSTSCGKITIGGESKQFIGPAYRDSTSPLDVFETIMELTGVDKAVFPQTPCYGPEYDYMDEIMREHPGKYSTIGLAFPCDGKERFMREAVEALDERGYLGLKFEMPDTPFVTDDPQNAYVFETLAERDKYCMIDLGWGQGEWDFPIDMITNTVKQYKDLTFIFPHLGISHLWDIGEYESFENLKRTLDLLSYNDNVWFDISGINFIARAFDDYPHPYCRKALAYVKQVIGMDHVMWGTDYPCLTLYDTYQHALDYVLKYCDFLTEEDKTKLFWKNADHLWFGIG